MKLPEDHFHMIPYIQGAETWIRLSKGHKLISIELIRLHRHRVEGEGFINSKIWRKQIHNDNIYKPRNVVDMFLAKYFIIIEDKIKIKNLRWCSWNLVVTDHEFCVPGIQRGWHSKWQGQKCLSFPSSLPATWFYNHNGRSFPGGLWIKGREKRK